MAADVLRDVYLHGALGDRFGRHFRLAVDCPAQAITCFCLQLKGFREAIEAGAWRVVRGDKEKGFAHGVDDLRLGLGRKALHIVPVVAGQGGRGRGIGKVIVGVALVAGAFFFAGPAGLGATLPGLAGTAGLTYGSIAGIGVSLALAGVSQILAPAPKPLNGRNEVDRRESFLFNGAENRSAQGIAVPLVYGRFRAGSIVVSTGLSTERL